MELICRQFLAVLEKLGVTRIEAQGQPFDPQKHDAVMHIEDENAGENTEKMEIGTLYAISVPTCRTGVNSTLRPQYVYCKKLWKTDSGAYPLFTEKVSVFYRGTFITGEEFDGNFDGFGATDREIPLPLSDPLSENSPESKWPTAFNSPSEFVVSKVIAGWTWALQYMRVGERWMLYIPWQSGYGASGSSSGDIPGYTSLTFDVCLEGIAD